MKTKVFKGFTIFTLVAIMSWASGLVTTAQAATTWTNWTLNINGNSPALNSLRVIVPASLAGSQARVILLIRMADTGLVSSTPNTSTARGYMRNGDVVVVTPTMMLWFDATAGGTPTTNGGGGMLRGLWPLAYDGSGSLNFERVTNTSNYAPSYLWCGSEPNRTGGGISLLANYGNNVDDGITLAIEHGNGTISAVTGTTINDGGPFHTDGTFVQFSGALRNSPGVTTPGIGSEYDTDPRAGIEGRTNYTLTYRIHPSEREFRQEISLNVTQNNLGPLGTLVVSTGIPGYDGRSVFFGSDVSLMNGMLGDMPINETATTFYNAPGMRFYELPSMAIWRGNVRWRETPLGQGSIISMGNPNNSQAPVKFLEVKVRPEWLPAAQQKTYFLQAIDNQAIGNYKAMGLDWPIFEVHRTPDAGVRTFPQGSRIDIIADYKIREVYAVTKVQGTGTTITAPSANVVNSGVANRLEAFTFTAAANAGYNASNLTVTAKVNGTPVTPTKSGDNYTIPAASVTGNIEITTSNLTQDGTGEPPVLNYVLGTQADAPYEPLLTAPYQISAGSDAYIGFPTGGTPAWASRYEHTLSSSNTTVATITAAGKITGVSNGTTTIKAVRDGGPNNAGLKDGATASFTLTVTDNTQQPPLTSDGRLKLKIVARKAADNPPAAAVTDMPILVLPANTAASVTGAGVLFINDTSSEAAVTRATQSGMVSPEPPAYTSYEIYPTGMATVSDYGGITTFGDCMLTIKAINDGRSGTITIPVGNTSVGINNTMAQDAINVRATETGIAAQFAGEAIVELYTINGILIDKAKACQFYSHSLDKGVYILRLNGQAVKFVK